jgi:hypothetical protein
VWLSRVGIVTFFQVPRRYNISIKKQLIMELVLTSKKTGRLTKQKDDYINKPSGFLHSQYKSVVEHSYKRQNKTSIFGIRQRIKSKNYAISCVAETTLKLSLFLLVMVMIFN